MTKKNNFWTLAMIIALCIGFSSCENKNENGNNENNGNSEHRALLVGQWHFLSGSLGERIGNTNAKIYHQQLTFNSVGNFSEVNFLQTGEERHNGNWSISGNVITLNDWDGNPLEKSISIVSLSENRLEISFSGSRAVFLRAGTEFTNLNTRILGRWNVPNSQSFLEFNNNGTGRSVNFVMSGSVMTQDRFDWSIEGNVLTRRSHHTTGSAGITIQTVVFCNDRYIGLKRGNNPISIFIRN